MGSVTSSMVDVWYSATGGALDGVGVEKDGFLGGGVEIGKGVSGGAGAGTGTTDAP
jgi:hypothetical protein